MATTSAVSSVSSERSQENKQVFNEYLTDQRENNSITGDCWGLLKTWNSILGTHNSWNQGPVVPQTKKITDYQMQSETVD